MIKSIMVAAGLALVLPACSDDQQQLEESMEGQEGQEEQQQEDGGFLPPEPELGEEGGELSESMPMAPDVMDADNAQNALPGGLGGGEGEGGGAAMASEGEGAAMGGANGVSYVRCSVLAIRTAPSTQSKRTGFLLFNSEVHPLGVTDHWVKIAENKWVSKIFLTPTINAKPTMPYGH